MRIIVDRQANVAYIRFCEQRGALETIRVTEDFLIDVDETGAVCGIELLNATKFFYRDLSLYLRQF